MPQTQATVGGLVSGADRLRQMIAQRAMADYEAEQQEYKRQQEAQKMALEARKVGADELRANTDRDVAMRPKPFTTSKISGLMSDGKTPATLFIRDDTHEVLHREPSPQTPRANSDTSEEATINAFARELGKSPDQLSKAERLQARKEWLAQSPPQFTYLPTPDGGITGVNRRDPNASAVPVPGAGAGIPLSAGQQDDMTMASDVLGLITEANRLGEKTNWSGVGALWTGTASQAAMDVGLSGTEDEESLRNTIGNINGTIAKLRGGTSFTEGEKALLAQYSPTINDGDVRIKAKLASLQKFLKDHEANVISTPRRIPPPAGAPVVPSGGRASGAGGAAGGAVKVQIGGRNVTFPNKAAADAAMAAAARIGGGR